MSETGKTTKTRAEGIDLSLVRENLRLSPRERLEQLERVVHDIDTLREAVRRQGKPSVDSSASLPVN